MDCNHDVFWFDSSQQTKTKAVFEGWLNWIRYIEIQIVVNGSWIIHQLTFFLGITSYAQSEQKWVESGNFWNSQKRKPLVMLVAGEGFEPSTFGLWVLCPPVLLVNINLY